MRRPFQINIAQAVLDDLKDRLIHTRWTDEIENSNWEYGTNLSYLRELCTYWQHTFDWRKQESYLNTFSQFKTTIDGIDIHFLHEKGKGKTVVPLLLTHGYPDSFVRFLKTIPLFTQADEEGFS